MVGHDRLGKDVSPPPPKPASPFQHRPINGRLRASLGEIAHALYGQREGGMQYALIRQALDHLYEVSLDLTVLSIENGDERWRRSRSARLLQVKDINERVDVEAHGVGYVELQLASWLVDQLDAHTVAAIAWQVLRRATGIAKRLAIYLAAHTNDFEAITRHTERFVVSLVVLFAQATRQRQPA